MVHNNMASRLIHRITVQRESGTSDGFGGVNRSWVNVGTYWAEIKPIMQRSISSERLYGDQLESSITHEILMRYTSGISADMRIVFDSRIFNIRTVFSPLEKKGILQMTAEEHVAV